MNWMHVVINESRYWRPIDHGFPDHGFENGFINRLIHATLLLISGIRRILGSMNL